MRTRIMDTVFVAVILTTFTPVPSFAQSFNIQARLEGFVTTPDTINGLSAMVVPETPIRFVFSADADAEFVATNFGFRFYSPNGSVNSLSMMIAPKGLPAWPDVLFAVSNGLYFDFRYDATLPDTLVVGWVTGFGDAWGPSTLVDVFDFTLEFPSVENGIVCLDSTYFPPAGEWLVVPGSGQDFGASWGDGAGFPDGGLCFTVSSAVSCCLTPGDANNSGSVNISDATFLISLIFSGGPGPPCADAANANADNAVNIGDATYLISYIFSGGPAPVCGTAGL